METDLSVTNVEARTSVQNNRGMLVIVLKKPFDNPFINTGIVKRGFGQPYDSTEEKERLIKCFSDDELVREVMEDKESFIKKYGEPEGGYNG